MLHTELGATTLEREESLALLCSVPIGRLVFTTRALPAVVPVNFVVDRGSVVIRTDARGRLAADVRDTVVAFQVDEFDTAGRTGWSVTVTGRMGTATDPGHLARLRELPLVPWAGGEREHFLVLPIELVEGRRVGVGVVHHATS